MSQPDTGQNRFRIALRASGMTIKIEGPLPLPFTGGAGADFTYIHSAGATVTLTRNRSPGS